MELVAIIGSPHGMKGNTGMLLQAVIDGARTAGANVTTFSLAEMNVEPCADCAVCHKTGECPQGDDFETVKQALLDADGIVLASPNYIFSVSAQMKALMDRCCGLLHIQGLEDRYAAAVITSGGGESAAVEEYVLHFLRNLGCWTVGSVGAEARHLHDSSARAERLNEAATLGQTLVDAVREKRTYPAQKVDRQAFYERMKALVTARRAEWPYEYEYWKASDRL